MLTTVFNNALDKTFDFVDNHLPAVAHFLDRVCDYADKHPDEMTAARLTAVDPALGGFYTGWKLGGRK